MRERIFLTYTNATAVPYQGSSMGHHVVLNYIAADGNHYTLQGLPQHSSKHNLEKLGAFVREEGLSTGENNRDSRFGRLQSDHHDQAIDELELAVPHTMIAEGRDLKSQWDRMRKFADDVNSTGYEYRPYSRTAIPLRRERSGTLAFLGRVPHFLKPSITRSSLILRAAEPILYLFQDLIADCRIRLAKLDPMASTHASEIGLRGPTASREILRDARLPTHLLHLCLTQARRPYPSFRRMISSLAIVTISSTTGLAIRLLRNRPHKLILASVS